MALWSLISSVTSARYYFPNEMCCNSEMCCLSALLVGCNPLGRPSIVTKAKCLAPSQTQVGSRNMKQHGFLVFNMSLELRGTTHFAVFDQYRTMYLIVRCQAVLHYTILERSQIGHILCRPLRKPCRRHG